MSTRPPPSGDLAAAEIESFLEWAANLSATAPFDVKTTEAPHYHRVLALCCAEGAAPAAGRARRAVTDGNGFLFIDHLGTICPSGFLPGLGRQPFAPATR